MVGGFLEPPDGTVQQRRKEQRNGSFFDEVSVGKGLDQCLQAGLFQLGVFPRVGHQFTGLVIKLVKVVGNALALYVGVNTYRVQSIGRNVVLQLGKEAVQQGRRGLGYLE